MGEVGSVQLFISPLLYKISVQWSLAALLYKSVQIEMAGAQTAVDRPVCMGG